MINTHTKLAHAALCTLALLIAGCGGGSEPEPSPEPNAEFDTVTMGYLPMISSLTYFVAVDQGYFTDEELEVDSIPITTSNDIASSLFAGDISIGVELSVVPLLKQGQGLDEPPYMIFSSSRIFTSEDNKAKSAFDSVLVNEDSPYKELKDLSGKKIAVFPGTTAMNTVLAIFAKEYGDLEPPKPLPRPPSQHLAMLEAGDVDALHAYEPFLTIGLKQRNMRRIADSLYAMQMDPVPSPIGVAAVNREWAQENPGVAKRAIRALDRAADFIDRYPVKARLIASEYTGIDPLIVSDMNVMPMSQSTKIDINGLDKYFGILIEMGEIPTVPAASEIVYNP